MATLFNSIVKSETMKEKCEYSNPKEAFKNFYNHIMDNTELSPNILEWLNTEIDSMPRKSDTMAESFRNDGNKLFGKGNHGAAILFYTKSLKFATYNGPDYGKALANRSAASYFLGEYEESLKDIVRCLKSQYPEKLRNKVQLRQLHCYYNLNMTDEFYVHVQKYYELFKGNELFEKLLKMKKKQNICPNNIKPSAGIISGLKLNEKFAYATSLVKLCYNEKSGRHVIAAKNIKAGNVLFQEKAFIASVYTDEYILRGICYHCLKDIPSSSLPCELCTYCLYCNEKCKQTSWSMGHRFECPGMIIWCLLGGLPAFKFLMKGIPSNFDEAPAVVTQFGDCIDNYPYANTLVTHFKERTDKLLLCTTALYHVTYLKYKTNFFNYFRARVDCPECENVEQFVGGLLVKHMAQLFCNGSCVVNAIIDEKIGSALYPSISMMNHSCASILSTDYDGCVAIVRATEDIPKGTEFFFNYGVDWQFNTNYRRKYLWEHYYFECDCEICSLAQNLSQLRIF